MRVAIVAGEASGDALGAGLIRALQQRVPEATFDGIAGPEMLALGCHTAFPMERLSVMGLFEVAGRYLELVPVRARLAAALIESRPDAFVGIDAPEFNLPLEAKLKHAGIPVVHYVSPSVWAWRRHRLRKIARSVDRMLCLFPFEPPIYHAHGIAADFVGHPMADRILHDDPTLSRDGARQRLGLASAGPVVALLPGSRVTEVTRLTAAMLEAARWLWRRVPGLQFLVPLANQRCADVVARHLRPEDRAGGRLQLCDGQSLEAMAAADVVLTASGTATLEAMLVGRPMVITYRAMELTWQIARRLSYVSQVGLPNLLAGRVLVPEMLQADASPQRLGAAVLQFLERPDLYARVAREFEQIGQGIRRGADRRAGEAVLEVAG